MSPHRRKFAGETDLVSESITYPSRSGLRVCGYWDHRVKDYENCPFVVVAPKYAETKKNNLQLAYMLASNGINVIRFDHTRHVGESGGVKTSFTLPGAVEDVHGTYDYIEERFGVKSAALVANSLSARTGIRAAAEDPRVSSLVCVVGVVNVQHTLREVFREDVIQKHIDGHRWNVVDNVLGNDADLDGFFGSAYESGMHDLEGTRVDLERIKVPVVFFSGDNDVWVSFKEVKRVVEGAPKGRVVLLEGAKHELRENNVVAENAFREIVMVIMKEAWGIARDPRTLQAPNKRTLLKQNQIERNRLREAAPRTESENEFWSEYLGKYVMLEHVTDYAEYLEMVGELVGPLKPEETILDAGCGNGLFGAWLLRTAKLRAESTLPATYVGLDLTRRGLRDAIERHSGMQIEKLRNVLGKANHAFNCFYARADFDHIDGLDGDRLMPQFADESFSAICCSLVLSYLHDPAVLLGEFRRLIRPDGRIVVSSMKPHNDISVIYKEFVESHEARQVQESARVLLSGVGQLKLKEEQGYYVFFSGEQLVDLMKAAGFRQLQVYTSFGDQAVIVRGTA